MSDRGNVFEMKRNDLLPALQVQFLNPDGTPRDITGLPVIFHMRKGNSLKVSTPATMVVASQGICEYRWSEGDTDEVGTFRAEFEVSGMDTYPKGGYIVVIIIEDLN